MACDIYYSYINTYTCILFKIGKLEVFDYIYIYIYIYVYDNLYIDNMLTWK